MIRKTDLEIEKIVSDVIVAERAAIEEEIQGCAAALLVEVDTDQVNDQVDDQIHDALMRLEGIEKYHAHLVDALGKLYEQESKR